MEESQLAFFPFPHVFRGRRRDGFTHAWPKRCIDCIDRPCESSSDSALSLCSYGVNFRWFTPELLVAGVVVRDYHTDTAARVKMLRQRQHHVSAADLEQARAWVLALESSETADRESRLAEVVDEFRRSREYESRVVELLKPEIEKAFGQVHDYRQFVDKIIANVNTMMRLRHPGIESSDALLMAASHEERAIYWAARMMETKLQSMMYLIYPERISAGEKSPIQFHKFVTKHLRIYQRAFEEKGISVKVLGESHGVLFGNDAAIGVIPHTLIDNAYKYAPGDSEVVVEFEESDHEIVLRVSSFGPFIREDERKKIFEMFYRGIRARKLQTEGTGLGLALAYAVAKQIGSDLSVSQDGSRRLGELVWTTFQARFWKPSADGDV